MDFRIAGAGRAATSETPDHLDKYAVPFREVLDIAIQRALESSGIQLPSDKYRNPGISFLTLTGEKFPEKVVEVHALGQRLKAHDFPGAVPNAAAGQAAIKYRLTGPQMVFLTGDPMDAAIMQLILDRSDLMLVCFYEWPGVANVTVLEGLRDRH